ncbi:unnamed protein product [Prorocentrum cordatum]|uniref:Uncharacterized protein n=1 Tax=Prorocentrum cordatum TaxID=2364126 RepID=A0ABN9XKX2_9DINO|nr:unnamed protein product [Polarella glacialis]
MESLLPGAEEWQPLPPMAHRRSDASSAVVGGRLYVCGGLDETEAASTAVERYDPEAAAWETLAPIAVGRLVASLAAIEGCLYVCGGSGAAPAGSDEAEGAEEAGAEPLRHCARFDPEANGGLGEWQDLPPLADARCSAGAAVLGGALYVCGGEGADGSALAGAERFDPRAGAWERLPAMRRARSFPSVEAL